MYIYIYVIVVTIIYLFIFFVCFFYQFFNSNECILFKYKIKIFHSPTCCRIRYARTVRYNRYRNCHRAYSTREQTSNYIWLLADASFSNSIVPEQAFLVRCLRRIGRFLIWHSSESGFGHHFIKHFVQYYNIFYLMMEVHKRFIYESIE